MASKDTCVKGGNCAIDVRTRKLCRFCRYCKCEAVGMRRNWVNPPQDGEAVPASDTKGSNPLVTAGPTKDCHWNPDNHQQRIESEFGFFGSVCIPQGKDDYDDSSKVCPSGSMGPHFFPMLSFIFRGIGRTGS